MLEPVWASATASGLTSVLGSKTHVRRGFSAKFRYLRPRDPPVQLSELVPVGIFRHPLAVASSLQRRNGFSIERGLELWHRYNVELLAALERDPFPLVDFDAGPADTHRFYG